MSSSEFQQPGFSGSTQQQNQKEKYRHATCRTDDKNPAWQ
jgi:hypothetical protein